MPRMSDSLEGVDVFAGLLAILLLMFNQNVQKDSELRKKHGKLTQKLLAQTQTTADKKKAIGLKQKNLLAKRRAIQQLQQKVYLATRNREGLKKQLESQRSLERTAQQKLSLLEARAKGVCTGFNPKFKIVPGPTIDIKRVMNRHTGKIIHRCESYAKLKRENRVSTSNSGSSRMLGGGSDVGQ